MPKEEFVFRNTVRSSHDLSEDLFEARKRLQELCKEYGEGRCICGSQSE